MVDVQTDKVSDLPRTIILYSTWNSSNGDRASFWEKKLL